jgi:hypothetical protein
MRPRGTAIRMPFGRVRVTSPPRSPAAAQRERAAQATAETARRRNSDSVYTCVRK